MKRLDRLSWLALFAAACFGTFFQACKHLPSLAASLPFLVDPYDAVGSFAVQVAGAVAALDLVRLYLIAKERVESREIYVVRGNEMVAWSIIVTLGADGIAVARSASPLAGYPGLAVTTAVVSLLALAAAVLAGCVDERRRLGRHAAPSTGENEFDRLFRRFGAGAVGPGRHPWRFSALVSLTMGLLVAVAQGVGEGVPPDVGRIVLVFAIFVAIEATGVFVGLLVIGRYLGVLPSGGRLGSRN